MAVYPVPFTREPRLKQPLGEATVSGHSRTTFYLCELSVVMVYLWLSPVLTEEAFLLKVSLKHTFLQKVALLTNQHFSNQEVSSQV